MRITRGLPTMTLYVFQVQSPKDPGLVNQHKANVARIAYSLKKNILSSEIYLNLISVIYQFTGRVYLFFMLHFNILKKNPLKIVTKSLYIHVPKQNNYTIKLLLLKNASYRKLQGKLLIREQTDLFLIIFGDSKTTAKLI